MQGKGSFVCVCFHYSLVILHQICSSTGTIAPFVFFCMQEGARRQSVPGWREGKGNTRLAEVWAVTCPGLTLPSKLSSFRHTVLLTLHDCGDSGLKATTESLE